MIDYSNIASSTEYYEASGFKRIESPWTVTPYVDEITKPKDVQEFELKHNGKRLVASGEQSFLYLYLKGFLPKGRFQTVTPCFRYEAFDFLHTKYFLKNELIDTENPDNYFEILQAAFAFFKPFFEGSRAKLEHEEVAYLQDDIFIVTDDGKFELGSYGKRKCDFLEWAYGTGCAEPRLSTLRKKYGISQ